MLNGPKPAQILDSIAESFYNVKYGSSTITSESSSENLSNENKHSVFPVHFGILIHVLSWRQQKHQCLFSLLRFSDELSDVRIDNLYLTL